MTTDEATTRNRNLWIALATVHILRAFVLVPVWIYLMIRDGFIATNYLQTPTAMIFGAISISLILLLKFLTRRAKLDGQPVMSESEERAATERTFWFHRALCIPFFIGGIFIELDPPAGRSPLFLYGWILLLTRDLVRCIGWGLRRSRAQAVINPAMNPESMDR